MTSNMSSLNTNFDPDYDSFLNLENDFTPSSTSPAIKSVPMLTPQSSIPGSATTFGSSSTPRPSLDPVSNTMPIINRLAFPLEH